MRSPPRSASLTRSLTPATPALTPTHALKPCRRRTALTAHRRRAHTPTCLPAQVTKYRMLSSKLLQARAAMLSAPSGPAAVDQLAAERYGSTNGLTLAPHPSMSSINAQNSTVMLADAFTGFGVGPGPQDGAIMLADAMGTFGLRPDPHSRKVQVNTRFSLARSPNNIYGTYS